MPVEDVLPRFDNTLGALLVGFAVSATAFGMLTIQVVVYYRCFPKDKTAYKTLVALIWLISFLDQILIGYAVYFYTITNYMNPLPLTTGKPLWCLILQTTMGAIIGAIVKTCFTLRVWRFSYRNWWLTGFLFLMVLVQLGTATAFTVKCFELPSFARVIGLRYLGSISLGIGVVTDMSIAAALCFYLQKMRSSHSNADSMINTLIIYAVNYWSSYQVGFTGTFQSLKRDTYSIYSTVSLSTLVLFNIMPTNFVFMCMYFVLSKLYAISFLATLNTRKIIRGHGTDPEGGRSTSFNMVSASVRPSVRKSIQLPTIHEEALAGTDVTRSCDSTIVVSISTPPYDLGW
ncbi:hypothetical protein BDR07DRAFT_1461870 [Suillus spraguei]|nr:hypothetical protein BDR07DRAFT_1461870 [Suillus spraguei]